MKLTVVIPIHNEVETIRTVVERVQAVNLDKEIILVDDGSTDGSDKIVEELRKEGFQTIHHTQNRGKGAAVRNGFDAAKGEVVVVQDADMEYDPQDLVQLIKPIEAGQAEVVYGFRTLETQKFVMRWGNHFVTWVANMMYGQQLKDMETCYKMMLRPIARSLELECRGFDVEAETTAKLLRAGHTIQELPISYVARYENKKLSPMDGIPTVQALWRYRKWKPKS